MVTRALVRVKLGACGAGRWQKSSPRAAETGKKSGMKATMLLGVGVGLALLSPLRGEAVKDREGAVRGDRAQMEKDARWIYNDVERGFAEAAKSGKPLLVALRCVPCLACMGMDAAILQSEELAPLLDQFVCVRVINANTLDLGLFQFDYDLSFSTLIFNADRTIYGRYGSWQHQKDHQDTSLESFQTALQRALALHADYPGNRASLKAKTGAPLPFQTPVEIPALAARYGRELDWQGNVVKSCVHCHQIGDALRAWHREAGRAVPVELLYPMPPPETLGLTVRAETVLRVEQVAAGSAAAEAGLQVGDELQALQGQPLISLADLAWVLHHAPAEGELALSIRRGTLAQEVTLKLAKDWRQRSDISRRVSTWSLRGMATGGLILEELDDAARQERGLPAEGMALRVKGLGMYGPHGAAKRAGFQQDDVLVRFDDVTDRLSEGELLGRLLLDPRGKRPVSVTLRRGPKELTLILPP